MERHVCQHVVHMEMLGGDTDRVPQTARGEEHPYAVAAPQSFPRQDSRTSAWSAGEGRRKGGEGHRRWV